MHIEVIRLLGNGFTTMEIADTLGNSRRTVETHKSNVYSILNVRNENELVRFAIDQEIIYRNELNFFPRDYVSRPPKKEKKQMRSIA